MTHAHTNEQSMARPRTGTVLLLIAALILIASGTIKLIGPAAVVRQLEGIGFAGKIQFVGALELSSGLLLLVPRTRSVGLLLASSFMGGAIATHLQHNELPVPATIVLAFIWLGSWLRYPVTLWSFASEAADPALNQQ